MTGAVTSGATTDVINLLAPIRDAYVRRRTTTEGGPGAGLATTRTERDLEPVWVEAIITVDPEGRVPWRFRIRGLDLSSVTIGLGDGAVIEVRSSTTGRGPTNRPDPQGRLHLPFSLLRAGGGEPGERLALIRLADEHTVGLVPVSRLGLRAHDHELRR